jgi:hypothetical protein
MWSLWEMISHFCAMFYAQFDNLRKEIELLQKSEQPHAILSQGEKERFDTAVVQPMEGEATRLQMLDVDETFIWNLLSLRRRLQDSEELSKAALKELLEQVHQTFYVRLSQLTFVYVPAPNDKYFEQDEMFGAKVYDRFPLARDDIKDAGNCYAVFLYTACVFHLMRVAELGLRAIADKVGAEITHNGQAIPLEYGDWNKVIEKIATKITAARKTVNPAEKEKIIGRYSEANDRLIRVRDQWRNDISHTRTRFNEPETRGILERIKELMIFLANTLELEW